MVPGDRPPLTDAARTWLASEGASSPDEVVAALRRALTDFVENRYGGAAEDLKAVHALRRRLFEDDRNLHSVSDANPGPWDRGTLHQAASASAPPDQGRMLFQLARALRPIRVLELGTNIGISAAYIALGLRHGNGGALTTIEASGIRMELARSHLAELGLEDVETVEGYFDNVLGDTLAAGPRVGLAFVDGNHLRDATLDYFHRLADHMGAGGVIVFDDIRWSEGMEEAWGEISRSERATHVVDLGRTGLVVTA